MEASSVSTDALPKAVVNNGRFEIPWKKWIRPGFGSVLKFMVCEGMAKIPSIQELDENLPVKKPDASLLSNPSHDKVQVTWLGHATVLVQMEGLNIMTDPIFSERCGPIALAPKRYRPVPCSIQELPNIDAVVISHNHYDHLDSTSVAQLNSRFGDAITWFVPLGLLTWMKSSGCNNVIELDWWQSHMFEKNGASVKFALTPAQHWSKRGINDDNQTLWGGWCVIGKDRRFYFAGDTGYDEKIFKLIGREYGPFDLSAIPIGAYSPRWFMQCQHIDPEQAMQIHRDVGSKNSIGIHWGTFNLSSESYLEPRDKIAELQVKEPDNVNFFTINPGETRTLT